MAALAFLNISEKQNDPFGELNEELSEDNDRYRYFGIYIIVIVIIKIAGCLCVLSADIFLICVICKFKKLRTRINLYIVICCIIHIYLYLYIPLDYLIFEAILNCEFKVIFLVDLETETAAIILYFILTLALALDWFLSSYTPSIMKIYNKYYLFFILGFTFTFVIGWSIKVVLGFIFQRYHMRFFEYDHIYLMYKMGMYVVILLGILILNVLKKILNLPKASIKNCYALTTANIIVLSFLPLCMYHFLSKVFTAHEFLEYILMWTASIPELIADVHPIIIVYMLGRRNKHFKMAYDRCFKRSLKSYASSNLDDDSDEENEMEHTPGAEDSLNENRDLQTDGQQQILVF